MFSLARRNVPYPPNGATLSQRLEKSIDHSPLGDFLISSDNKVKPYSDHVIGILENLACTDIFSSILAKELGQEGPNELGNINEILKEWEYNPKKHSILKIITEINNREGGGRGNYPLKIKK